MLYRYLFNKHATDSFDWTRLWSHVDLSPQDILSASFLQQTKAICIGSNLEDVLHLTTIGQLAEYLRDLHLEVGQLQEQLELVYRWRGSSNSSPRRLRRKDTKNDSSAKDTEKSTDNDDTALQAAIAASLKDEAGPAKTPIAIDVGAESKPKEAIDDSGMFVDDMAQDTSDAKRTRADDARQTAPSQSAVTSHASQDSAVSRSQGDSNLQTPSSTPMDIWDIANKAEIVRGEEEGSIIGTEKFTYNEEDMLKYVMNTVAFWNGRVSTVQHQSVAVFRILLIADLQPFDLQQEPQGVSLEETNKCRSCEFQDGCEWLAMKAEEHRVKARERRMAKGSIS